MSTPTTATATLPPYAAGYPFAHQSSYRQTMPGSSTRLAPPQVSSSSSTTNYAPYSPSSAPNGVHLAAPSVVINSTSATANHAASHPTHTGTMHSYTPSHTRPAVYQNHTAASSPSYTTSSTTVTATTTSTRQQQYGPVSDSTATMTSTPAGPSPHRTHSSHHGSQPRKRRRSGPPDWETFYKNGLPQEVIVIEDSPERDGQNTQDSQHAHYRHVRSDGAHGDGYRYADDDHEHVAKKRRRQDDSGGRFVDPAHNYLHQPSSGSTISSERTHSYSIGSMYVTGGTSTAANTAATSLASSNSVYEYDTGTLAVAGQKRRRNTRQQAANESRKRDRELAATGLAYTNYRPPPLPPVKASDVDVKVIHDAHYSKHIKVDDDDGHYIVIPDADLTDRYQMVKLLGQGTFGKVVQARDRRRNELVAVKIIRSVQKYRDASRIELRVLETLKANDRENRNRCIHLRECFDFRGHICIVMDLLGQSVFDFLKGNGFVPFPNSQIQSFARQLFTSVAFLHDLQLIHTDLKPENILLVDSTYQTFTYNRKIPSSSTTIARQATQRKVLLDTEIRLIDFGSATFQDEYHSSVVSTRHYRAPEIILGLGWSFPCDIWSIGCILVEFFTGDALFQTHDNLEHLAMMEAVCDARMDTHLVQQVVKATRHGGNAASKYFKRLRLDYPSADTTRASKRFVKAMKKLNDIIPNNSPFLRQFLDLLRRIFIYDPAQRITAKEALQHPWFRELAIQDDGTEAAKIRQERADGIRERLITRVAHYHA